MTDNDNTVNIDSRARRYHHGDLRAALLAAGMALIQRQPGEELSLRELARGVGVSATAVYRHFPDKRALVEALCAEGRAMLAEAQRVAMAAAGGGQAGFNASGVAYVRFALAHPALFRLMIKTRAPGDAPRPTAAGPALRELEANVAAILPTEAAARQRQLRAIAAWSLVHGLALLILDARLPDDPEMIAEVIAGGA